MTAAGGSISGQAESAHREPAGVACEENAEKRAKFKQPRAGKRVAVFEVQETRLAQLPEDRHAFTSPGAISYTGRLVLDAPLDE